MNRIDGARVVFLDMDHTLIDNDCDVSWKEFLIQEGIAPPSERDDIYRYFELYKQARLPEDEFNKFQLRQFAGRTHEEVVPLARAHFERHVRPRIFPQALAAIDEHRRAGRRLVLLTATNRVVAEPVAEHLGLPEIVATELECRDGRYTGRLGGRYCVKEGKVAYASQWCERNAIGLVEAAYYGDSMSDIPLLERVGHPVVVNPPEKLAALAADRGWPILQWRLETP